MTSITEDLRGDLHVLLFDCGRQRGKRVLQMTITLRRFLN